MRSSTPILRWTLFLALMTVSLHAQDAAVATGQRGQQIERGFRLIRARIEARQVECDGAVQRLDHGRAGGQL